jgi:hypothetical protein
LRSVGGIKIIEDDRSIECVGGVKGTRNVDSVGATFSSKFMLTLLPCTTLFPPPGFIEKILNVDFWIDKDR